MIKKIFPLVFLFAFAACSNGPLPGMGDDKPADVIAPAIISFTADKTTITQGENVTLSWETEAAGDIILDPVGPQTDPVGSATLTPETSTTYTLSVYSPDAPASEDGEAVDSQSITITVNPIDDDDTDEGENNDPCATAPNPTTLKNELTFTASRTGVYAGESVTLTWNNAMSDSDTVVTLPDGTNLSEASGTETVVVTQNGTAKIQTSVCGVTAEKTLSITAKAAIPFNLPPVASLSGTDSKTWVGTTDGKVYRSTDLGKTWNYITTASGILEKNESKKGESPIVAVASGGDVCNGAIFIATQNGHLYRSYDDGAHASGLTGGPNYMLAITKSGSHDAKDYSKISFLLKNPKHPKELLIGHEEGLWRLKDCTATGGVTENISKVSLFDKKPVTQGIKNGKKVFVVSGGSVYQSDDTLTWEKSNFTGNSGITWLEAKGDGLYAGSATTVYQTEDANEWSVVSSGHYSITGFALDGASELYGDYRGLKIAKDTSFYLDGIESGIGQMWFKGNSVWMLTKDSKLYMLDIVNWQGMLNSITFNKINLNFNGATLKK
ncbi:hypothetical protein K1X76_04925 [bacterium]|nr:hypothetical protein [bacterium]